MLPGEAEPSRDGELLLKEFIAETSF